MTPRPNIWLITGASRGLGLEFVRQLATATSEINIVLAACRTPEKAVKLRELQSETELARRGEKMKSAVLVFELDVKDEKSTTEAPRTNAGVAKVLDEFGLDYLVNNAAVTEGDDPASTLTFSGLVDTFATNVAGPALVTQALIPYLEKGQRKVVANISSGLASFTMDYGKKAASYSISKAAMNMLTYKQARERPDIITFMVAPGWVKTDMGGLDAPLEPNQAVAGMLKLIQHATNESAGRFINWDGEEIPP